MATKTSSASLTGLWLIDLEFFSVRQAVCSCNRSCALQHAANKLLQRLGILCPLIAFISVTSAPNLLACSAGCMRMCMWHRDQKSVCHCHIALLQKAQT